MLKLQGIINIVDEMKDFDLKINLIFFYAFGFKINQQTRPLYEMKKWAIKFAKENPKYIDMANAIFFYNSFA